MRFDGRRSATSAHVAAVAALCTLVLTLSVGPVAAGPRQGAGDTVATSVPGWALVSTPNPAHSLFARLGAVDCTTGVDCMAVGTYSTIDGKIRTLAERWDGMVWTIVHTPNRLHDVYNILDSVSCLAPDECIAVGSSLGAVGRALVERWDGKSWTIQATPSPPKWPGLGLRSVSCTAVDACTAVGIRRNSDTTQPLVMTWGGKRWSMRSGPPPSAAGADLEGVSCVRSDVCEAIGGHSYSYGGAFHGSSFALGWDGSSWSYQPQPNPGDTHKVYDMDVSCSSAAACTSVGTWNSEHRFRPLVNRWDGTTWARQQIPNPPGDFVYSALQGVSCPSTTSCTAVGYWSKNHRGYPASALAYGWHGTGWTLQSPQDQPGADVTLLTAVDCISPTTCMAVGEYVAGGQVFTLSEVYTG